MIVSAEEVAVDWTDCPMIETVPGKLSGVPVIQHSRVRPEDLIINRNEGEEWLADAYRLPLSTVRSVLSFHDEHIGHFAPAV